MSLAHELSTTHEKLQKGLPVDALSTILTANADFKASFDPKSAIQVGQPLPKFLLSNANGKEVSSVDLIAKGPLLISFYRGEWCPFCNIALRGLQQHVEEFKAKNVTLVAISPELPNGSLSMKEKNELTFEVLSDVGNKFAEKLGIVWAQPKALQSVLDTLGHDLKTRNGDDSYKVPIPATLLVDRKGIVRNTFIETEYTQRAEPATVLKWIDEL